MIVEYKRDLYRNYLVILQEKKERLTYEVKMMQNNKIEGMLPMQIKSIDGKDFYYYDISSLQPCFELYQKGKLSGKEIQRLMEGILTVIERGKEFLLKENNFVLDPQYLYMNPSNYKVSLCYVPGYGTDIVTQVNAMLEFVLDRVDYQEEQAVFLAYSLYKENREKTSTLLDLRKIIQKELKVSEILEVADEKEPETLKKNKTRTSEIERKPKVVLEEREEEILSYTPITIIKCIVLILAGVCFISMLVYFGIFRNSVNKGFELPKFSLCLAVVGLIEFAGLQYFLDEKYRVSKIKSMVDQRILTDSNQKSVSGELVSRESISQELERQEVINQKCINSEAEQTILLSEETNYKEETFYLSSCEKGYQDILLTEFPFFIGKLKTNVDYTIDDNSISRFHAKIEKEEELFFLTDLNSTNGTFINGCRLDTNKRTNIELNDQITFAKIDFIFNKI